LLQQRSKQPREIVTTPKASTSLFAFEQGVLRFYKGRVCVREGSTFSVCLFSSMPMCECSAVRLRGRARCVAPRASADVASAA